MGISAGPYIIRDSSLVFEVDASDKNSYVSGSGVLYNLVRSNSSGSLINGPTFDSANGGSIVFDGTNDYVALGNPTTLNLTANITISSWIKLSSLPSEGSLYTIYEKGFDSSREQTFFRFYTTIGVSYLQFGTYVASNDTSYMTSYALTSSLVVNKWNNFVGNYDGSKWNLYINGTLVSQTQNNTPPQSSTSPISIGAAYIISGYSRFINGRISIVSVYDRALTTQEIQQNYNALKSRFNL